MTGYEKDHCVMKNSIRKQHGFMLVELIIVFAIIAILTGIAIPVYRDYAIRSNVSEGLSLASVAKTAVTESFASSGRFPAATNTSYQLPAPVSISGAYVSSVSVAAQGVVVVEYKTIAAGKVDSGDTILLQPATVSKGSLRWTCRTVDIPKKYLPANCQ